MVEHSSGGSSRRAPSDARREIWRSRRSGVGAEIKKTRPAIVVQNDPSNRRSPVTIVAAVSSQFEAPLYPTEVLVRAPEGGLTVDSVVLLNQIRSVDKGRLVRRLGVLKSETMRAVDRALLLSLGLVEL